MLFRIRKAFDIMFLKHSVRKVIFLFLPILKFRQEDRQIALALENSQHLILYIKVSPRIEKTKMKKHLRTMTLFLVFHAESSL